MGFYVYEKRKVGANNHSLQVILQLKPLNPALLVALCEAVENNQILDLGEMQNIMIVAEVYGLLVKSCTKTKFIVVLTDSSRLLTSMENTWYSFSIVSGLEILPTSGLWRVFDCDDAYFLARELPNKYTKLWRQVGEEPELLQLASFVLALVYVGKRAHCGMTLSYAENL